MGRALERLTNNVVNTSNEVDRDHCFKEEGLEVVRAEADNITVKEGWEVHCQD